VVYKVIWGRKVVWVWGGGGEGGRGEVSLFSQHHCPGKENRVARRKFQISYYYYNYYYYYLSRSSFAIVFVFTSPSSRWPFSLYALLLFCVRWCSRCGRIRRVSRSGPQSWWPQTIWNIYLFVYVFHHLFFSHRCLRVWTAGRTRGIANVADWRCRTWLIEIDIVGDGLRTSCPARMNNDTII